MFVGFSKNLGNGFRIGIGYNLNNNKPSKRDNDREEFVSKVLSEIKNLFQEICNKLNISQETFKFAIEQNCQIEITDILTENNSKKMSEISDIFSNISELIEKVSFQKVYQLKRKKKLQILFLNQKK